MRRICGYFLYKFGIEFQICTTHAILICMITRIIETKIKSIQGKYPVILISGPRQSGKTILVKSLFPDYTYKNLENPDERLLAKSDPRSFLNLESDEKMIIDEIQEVPELVSYIQVEVDAKDRGTRYILTGSQNFKISETVSQSLAGRVANFELLPFSFPEVSSQYSIEDIETYILSGSYPRKYDKDIAPFDYYRDYISTYITRDVRSLKHIGDLTHFQRFIQLLAGRAGQILNVSSLANDLGMSVKTIDSWISVLEASYIVFRLQPYYENFNKRLTKSPKIFFYDTGLLAYLLGIDSVAELRSHFAYGSLFENVIVSEVIKRIWNKRAPEEVYFWRDSRGTEVDLIIDKGLYKDFIEIKSSKTFNQDFLRGIRSVQDLFSSKYKTQGYVVYNGRVEQLIEGVRLVYWERFVGEHMRE